MEIVKLSCWAILKYDEDIWKGIYFVNAAFAELFYRWVTDDSNKWDTQQLCHLGLVENFNKSYLISKEDNNKIKWYCFVLFCFVFVKDVDILQEFYRLCEDK